MNLLKKEELNIWAVVVTFNRLELLKRNIQSIKSQIFMPNKILVINNGSTDGSGEWLALQNDIITITQENTGGAGGFYRGFKEAYERGAEWIWAMDEDGEAEESTLLELTKCIKPGIYILNSLVLDILNRERLSSAIAENFNLEERSTLKIHYDCTELNRRKLSSLDKIVGFPFFFNSSLISKKIIQEIGFPNKNFFIRGDEIDFYYRILQSNYIAYICLNSIYRHPSTMHSQINFLGKSFFYEKMNTFKFFYHVRNTIFLRNKYLTKGRKVEQIIFAKGGDILLKEFIVFLKNEKSFSELSLAIKTFFKAKRDLKKIENKLDQNKFWQ